MHLLPMCVYPGQPGTGSGDCTVVDHIARIDLVETAEVASRDDVFAKLVSQQVSHQRHAHHRLLMALARDNVNLAGVPYRTVAGSLNVEPVVIHETSPIGGAGTDTDCSDD